LTLDVFHGDNTRMMKKIASLLLLLAIAAAITGAIRWRGGSAEIAALNGERAPLQAQLDTTRADLHKTGLRYRGFIQGASAMPDSIRTAEAGETMKQTNLYRKAISRLEGEERRLVVSIDKIDRSLVAATAARRRSARPFALVAALLLVAGGGLYALARQQRVAS
jgi:hypothetical protein